MSTLEFRASTLADEAEIAALLQESFGVPPNHPLIEPRHMRWKYWEPRPDWAGSRSYVYLQGGRIVAHGAIVPGVCVWRGHRITALHLIDWAAKQNSAGSGVTLMKKIGRLADALFSVGGSELTRQILPVIGFKDTGTVVSRYARPIRPLLRLKNPYGGWRLLPQVVRGAYWALTAPSRRDSQWTAQAVSADAVEAASIVWPAAQFGAAVFERSSSWMEYMLRCPVAPMELYSVHKNGEVRGYFLLGFAPAQARIVDCWIDSDNPSDWNALTQLAVVRAKAHPSVAEVVSESSDPLFAAALIECGFRIRHSISMWWRGAARPDVPLRFMMVDTDAAFLHGGSAILWA